MAPPSRARYSDGARDLPENSHAASTARGPFPANSR
jgi:hypothetical protein